jgi:hypothetical protein
LPNKNTYETEVKLSNRDFHFGDVADEVDERHEAVDFFLFQLLALDVLDVVENVDLQLQTDLVVVGHQLFVAGSGRWLRLLTEILQSSEGFFRLLNRCEDFVD